MPKGIYKRHPKPRKRPQPRTRPNYFGRAVLVQQPGQPMRGMSAAEAARQQGRSKGGRKVQALGTGHRFTSETARAAALKLWTKKWRKLKVGGVLPKAIRDSENAEEARGTLRIGMPSKRAPRTNRAALRVLYAWAPGRSEYFHVKPVGEHVWYDPFFKEWYAVSDPPDGKWGQQVSERTALRRLNVLPSPNGFVPKTVIQVPLIKRKDQ